MEYSGRFTSKSRSARPTYLVPEPAWAYPESRRLNGRPLNVGKSPIVLCQPRSGLRKASLTIRPSDRGGCSDGRDRRISRPFGVGALLKDVSAGFHKLVCAGQLDLEDRPTRDSAQLDRSVQEIRSYEPSRSNSLRDKIRTHGRPPAQEYRLRLKRP